MLYYKIDVISELKKKGYSTYKLRQEKILGNAQIQALKHEKPIHWTTIEKLCELLDCEPAAIIGRKKDG